MTIEEHKMIVRRFFEEAYQRREGLRVALLVALAWTVAPAAEAQAPIRIGVSASNKRAYAALGQNQLRGYQLWSSTGGVRE